MPAHTRPPVHWKLLDWKRFDWKHLWPLAAWCGLCALFILGWPHAGNKARTRLRVTFALELAFIAAVVASCGGGGGGSYVPPPPPPPPTQFPTSTTLTTNLPNVPAGNTVTFTAKVTGNGSPTGSVAFMAGGSYLGNSNLVAGTATLTTSIASPGIYSVTAQYNGDFQNLASTSAGVSQVVSGSTVIQVYGNTSVLSHVANITVTLQ
jgi:hypothetical protein